MINRWFGIGWSCVERELEVNSKWNTWEWNREIETWAPFVEPTVKPTWVPSWQPSWKRTRVGNFQDNFDVCFEVDWWLDHDEFRITFSLYSYVMNTATNVDARSSPNRNLKLRESDAGGGSKGSYHLAMDLEVNCSQLGSDSLWVTRNRVLPPERTNRLESYYWTESWHCNSRWTHSTQKKWTKLNSGKLDDLLGERESPLGTLSKTQCKPKNLFLQRTKSIELIKIVNEINIKHFSKVTPALRLLFISTENCFTVVLFSLIMIPSINMNINISSMNETAVFSSPSCFYGKLGKTTHDPFLKLPLLCRPLFLPTVNSVKLGNIPLRGCFAALLSPFLSLSLSVSLLFLFVIVDSMALWWAAFVP